MAEGTESLRELLQGFNSMQASLGLLPGGSPTPRQTPTPPPVKHPGQISQEMMQIAMQQLAEQSVQIQRTRQLQAPGVMGLLPAAAPAPPAAGEYNRQFKGRMEDIESRYLEPFQANRMARGMGQEGFQMMPSPVFQTAPSMGIYRPTPQPRVAPNMMPPGGMPAPPLYPMPLRPRQPPSQFATPFQQRQQLRTIQHEQDFAEGMAAIPTAAYMGAGTLTTAVGMGLGGRAGAGIAARAGAGAATKGLARFGGRIGGIAAGAAAGFGLLGFGAERGAEAALEPAIETRGFGRQLQNISQQFVVGGPDLSESGRGLSTRAAIKTASKMQQGVEKKQMAGFNMRDIMGITKQAADQGMLDMAQNSSQITQQVRNVARGLKAFMQIAQEPDVKQAMSMMGQMRTMGLTIPETNMAMRNASQFARMAGVDTKEAIAQGGLPGAMTFQRMGMSAGLGLQVGTAAMGMARQGIASGAFTPGQLAMAGGQAGVTQTMTEAAGAGLGIDFPILSMLGRNKQGELQIDPDRARKVMSGQMSLSQQATEGAQNMQRLGGEKVIMELSTRMNEIRDQLGRQLGPQGSVLLALRQATNTMKEVPGLSLGGALRMMGMDPQQARSMELMGQSPKFWQGLKKQHEVNIQEHRAEETQRRERAQEANSISSRAGRWWDKGPGMVVDRFRERFSEVREGIAQWRSQRQERLEAGRRGETYTPTSKVLQNITAPEQRAIDKFVQTKEFDRYQERTQVAKKSAERGSERGITGTLRGLWNASQFMGRIAASVIPATASASAAAEMTGAADFTTIEGAEDSTYIKAQKARGGIGGWFAEVAPNLSEAVNVTSPMGDKFRAAKIEQARSAGRVGKALQRGERMSTEEVVRTGKQVDRELREEFRAVGVDSDDESQKALETAAVEGLSAIFKRKALKSSQGFGTEAPTEKELKDAVVKRWVDSGKMTREKAIKIVNKKWDTIGPLYMRRVKQGATTEMKSIIAKSEEATGFISDETGKDMDQQLKDIEKKEDDIRDNVGLGGFLDSSQAWEDFKTIATTSSSDEVLMMQAAALRKDGDDEAAAAIEKGIEKRLPADQLRKLRDSASKRVDSMNKTQKEALTESGTEISKLTPEQQLKKTEETRKALTGGRGQSQLIAGTKAFVDRNIKSFDAMHKGGGTTESTEQTLQNLTKNKADLDELRKTDPAMAKMVDEYEKASSPEERKAVARKFKGVVQKQGKDAGTRSGGKGVGGAAEQKEREQMGTEEEIRQAIEEGKPGEAFATAIPHFSKASEKLLETTEKMDSMIKAASILFRFPGTY